MQKIKIQNFDFTSESNQEELAKWEAGIRDIPFPLNQYWVNSLSLSEEDMAETEIAATYQFVDINEDTWFWVSVLFKKDGTASLDYNQNYSTNDAHRLLPIVNRSLERIGLEARTELEVCNEVEFKTWQEGYDFLCKIAQQRKVAAFQS